MEEIWPKSVVTQHSKDQNIMANSEKNVSFIYFQSPGVEEDLETSLYLVGEIDELTKKMMDTVEGELKHYKKRKDFGSSVW